MSANRTDGDVVGGVRLGVHSSSFRELRPKPGDDGIDTLIQAMTACDARDCELAAPLVEPAYGGQAASHHTETSAMTPQMMRRELRKWRLRTPMEHFARIGARFQQAGIAVSAYNYSPDSTFTDDEIDRGFSAAKALGAETLTASMTPDIARRVAPFADKHRMAVACRRTWPRRCRCRRTSGSTTSETSRPHSDPVASFVIITRRSPACLKDCRRTARRRR